MGERHKGHNGEVGTDYIKTFKKKSTRVSDVYLVQCYCARIDSGRGNTTLMG